MLYHLSYVSTQTRPMTAKDLTAILEEARTANETNEITGLLLHREDSFMQVLEGDKDKVLETFVRIEGDKRHEDVKILFSEPCESREFSDWTMAFVNLDGININEVSGFSDFLIDNEVSREIFEELSRVKRTLHLFRAMN